MKIIPSIDIYKNNIVRLLRGDFKKLTVYNIKLKKLLKYFIKKKIRLINLIDLEGAKKKKIINKKKICKIINIMKYYNIKCNVGGGIRKYKHIKYYIKKGAKKIILGSNALKKDFILKLIKNYKKKIIISVDIFNNNVMLESWKKKSLYYKEFFNKVLKYYKGTFIVTNIKLDGTKKGININFLKKIIKIVKNYKIIFAGGFSGKKDIKKLKKNKIYKNIKGYIVGKYIYEKLK
ncbi:HisA/HisF-related TIM barrel protein [Candidatus Vidania fulgoroideorum]